MESTWTEGSQGVLARAEYQRGALCKAGEGGLGIRRFKKYRSKSKKSMPKPGQCSLLQQEDSCCLIQRYLPSALGSLSLRGDAL